VVAVVTVIVVTVTETARKGNSEMKTRAIRDSRILLPAHELQESSISFGWLSESLQLADIKVSFEVGVQKIREWVQRIPLNLLLPR
jgi:hypothetical protein